MRHLWERSGMDITGTVAIPKVMGFPEGEGKERKKVMNDKAIFLKFGFYLAALLVVACSDPPTTKDDTPPARISDLEVLDVTDTTLEISWTAPGDDGMEGSASQYRVLYSMVPFDEASDEDLIEVPSPPVPDEAGASQSMSVEGLSPGLRYFLAVEAADEVPNWSPRSNVVEVTTTETSGSCQPLPITEREDCLDDMEREDFLNPFGMLISPTETPSELIGRFVEAPLTELHSCDDYGDPVQSLEVAWWIWSHLRTSRMIYDKLLSSCEPFVDGPGVGFEQRLGEVEDVVEECLVGQLFPDRPGSFDQLREGGNLHHILDFLLGITSYELASEVPEGCVDLECVIDAFFDEERAEIVKRIYRSTGFVIQSWSPDPYEEVGTWTKDDLLLMEEALDELLDCDRMGSIFQFHFLPVRHLRLLGEEEIDAGHDGTGFSISHYFMYDSSGAPDPERLRFVLGHEMAHAASDEIGIRRGFDPRVFGECSPPDPEQYFDPEYIEIVERIRRLELDLVEVGPPREPQGFLDEDLDSGRLNPLLLDNGRSLPFIRNPAVVTVDDMYADAWVFSDGLIRAENPRGYREAIADLIIGFKEFPHLFFEADRLIVSEGYFFVRENFFNGQDAVLLTAEQGAEIARVDELGTVEARRMDFQAVAAELREAYCVAEPDLCPVYELPELDTPRQEAIFGVLEMLAVRGRDARRVALRSVLEEASLPFDEEVTSVGPDEEIVNFVITIGDGPVRVAIGAHWDAFSGSRGAVDNGSGVAVLLDLGKVLSSDPPDGFSVQLIFFDREEEGMLGSQEFVNRHLSELPPLLVNVDMCGLGNTLMVGPTEGATSELLGALRDASELAGVPTAEFPFVPPSDHESFLDEGVPSMMITMLSSSDIDAFTRIYQEDFSVLPEILAIKDTQFDTLHQIEPVALVQCAEFISSFVDSI